MNKTMKDGVCGNCGSLDVYYDCMDCCDDKTINGNTIGLQRFTCNDCGYTTYQKFELKIVIISQKVKNKRINIMSTNYYILTGNKIKKTCEYGCEHMVDEKLHIGLYSYGWMFSLHIYPEKGINEFNDWEPLLKSGKIIDEYDKIITFEDMKQIILKTNEKFERKHQMLDFLDYDGFLYVPNDTVGKYGKYVLVDTDFF